MAVLEKNVLPLLIEVIGDYPQFIPPNTSEGWLANNTDSPIVITIQGISTKIAVGQTLSWSVNGGNPYPAIDVSVGSVGGSGFVNAMVSF